jgi:RNA polymerase sigma factor (sigma-70 family)
MTELLPGVDTPSDAELISRVRGGDVDAYGELFSRHVEAARRLGRQLMRGPDVDDLVSEAFAKTLQVIQAGGGPDVAFRAYLLTSVRRLHVDRIRASKKVQPTEDMTVYDDGLPFQDTAVASFENGAAARAFTSLPERWQLVLWHLEVEGQKPAEIAPLLGMSANSVSALAYRAREGLRQAFLTMHLADCPTEQCRWVNQHLGAYVRKGLSRRDTTKVEQHLDECRRCTAMYLELDEVNSNLAAIIAPLLLGAAAAGYVSAAGGAGLTGLSAFFGRVRDAFGAQGGSGATGAGSAGATGATATGTAAAASGAVTVGGVLTIGGAAAAGIAAVTAAALVFGGGFKHPTTQAERPAGVVQTPPADPDAGSTTGGDEATGPERPAEPPVETSTVVVVAADDPGGTSGGATPAQGSQDTVGAATDTSAHDSRPAPDRTSRDTSADPEPSDGDSQQGEQGPAPTAPTIDLPSPLPTIPAPTIPAPTIPVPVPLPPTDDSPGLPGSVEDSTSGGGGASTGGGSGTSTGDPATGDEPGDEPGDTGGSTGDNTGGGTGSETGTGGPGDQQPGSGDGEDGDPGDGDAEAPLPLTIEDARIVNGWLLFDLGGQDGVPGTFTVELTQAPPGVGFAPDGVTTTTESRDVSGGIVRVALPLRVTAEPPADSTLAFTVVAEGYAAPDTPVELPCTQELAGITVTGLNPRRDGGGSSDTAVTWDLSVATHGLAESQLADPASWQVFRDDGAEPGGPDAPLRVTKVEQTGDQDFVVTLSVPRGQRRDDLRLVLRLVPVGYETTFDLPAVEQGRSGNQDAGTAPGPVESAGETGVDPSPQAPATPSSAPSSARPSPAPSQPPVPAHPPVPALPPVPAHPPVPADQPDQVKAGPGKGAHGKGAHGKAAHGKHSSGNAPVGRDVWRDPTTQRSAKADEPLDTPVPGDRHHGQREKRGPSSADASRVPIDVIARAFDRDH